MTTTNTASKTATNISGTISNVKTGTYANGTEYVIAAFTTSKGAKLRARAAGKAMAATKDAFVEGNKVTFYGEVGRDGLVQVYSLSAGRNRKAETETVALAA